MQHSLIIGILFGNPSMKFGKFSRANEFEIENQLVIKMQKTQRIDRARLGCKSVINFQCDIKMFPKWENLYGKGKWLVSAAAILFALGRNATLLHRLALLNFILQSCCFCYFKMDFITGLFSLHRLDKIYYRQEMFYIYDSVFCRLDLAYVMGMYELTFPNVY